MQTFATSLLQAAIRRLIDQGELWKTGEDADHYNVSADHVAAGIMSLIEALPMGAGEAVAWEWRSKLGPAGWDTASLGRNDPGELNDQYEKRALVVRPSHGDARSVITLLEENAQIESDHAMAHTKLLDAEHALRNPRVTPAMVTAFYQAVEVTREGSIRRIEEGLRAAFVASPIPDSNVYPVA